MDFPSLYITLDFSGLYDRSHCTYEMLHKHEAQRLHLRSVLSFCVVYSCCTDPTRPLSPFCVIPDSCGKRSTALHDHAGTMTNSKEAPHCEIEEYIGTPCLMCTSNMIGAESRNNLIPNLPRYVIQCPTGCYHRLSRIAGLLLTLLTSQRRAAKIGV